MIDSQHETLISLADVPAILPVRRGGRRPHISCIYRWAQRGLKGVRLEVIQVGGTSCTSKEALQRFFDRLTAVRNGQPVAQRTPRQRSIASEKANAELEASGW